MKKFVSRFVLLLVSLRKINVAKAEPKTIVVPARAHKSSDWILVHKTSTTTETRCCAVRGEDGE